MRLTFFLTFLLIIVFFVDIDYSQDLSREELDSLFNKLIYLNSHGLKDKSIKSVLGEVEQEKCGFGLISTIKVNYSRFTPQQQQNIKKILQVPDLQTSFITPNGFFRVHYDSVIRRDTVNIIPIDTNNIPSYDNRPLKECLDLISQTLDSVYNFEIKNLGYLFPNPDNSPYDIYISNSTLNSYGYTEPDSSRDNGTYSSHIVIHNNYSNFKTKGINGARVTLAHEFHHAIQIGRYIYRYDLDEFFYELSATAMEEFVYDSINDYYNYLPSYFNNTQNAFACSSCNGGRQQYALAIWNIFLRDRFGYDILRKQWELMPQMRAMDAISTSISQYGSTYKKEFSEFGVWLFYTDDRAIEGKYFKEAANYPLPDFINKYNLPVSEIQGSAYPTSQNFIRFFNQKDSGDIDTIDVIVTNSDYRNGINNLSSLFPYQLSVSYSSSSGKINYYTYLTADNSSLWSNTIILNNEIIPTLVLNYAYPNPFFYNKNNHIEIPTAAGNSQKVDLNIYTVSMILVYSDNDYASPGKKGSFVLKWNGLDSKGKKLPSGVYIYITKNGNSTTLGKIVIFNE